MPQPQVVKLSPELLSKLLDPKSLGDPSIIQDNITGNLTMASDIYLPPQGQSTMDRMRGPMSPQYNPNWWDVNPASRNSPFAEHDINLPQESGVNIGPSDLTRLLKVIIGSGGY